MAVTGYNLRSLDHQSKVGYAPGHMSRDDLQYWLTLSGILVLGLLLVWSPWRETTFWPTVQEALPRIGEALFVAVLLAAFVDKYVKSKLIKDIAPWSAHLPDEVRTEIADLLTLATVRRNVELTLKFSHVSTPEGFLQLETHVKFDVENMTN